MLSPFLHLTHDSSMLLLHQLRVVLRNLLSPVRLPNNSNANRKSQQCRETPVRHVHRLLLLAVARIVVPLPVLPRRIPRRGVLSRSPFTVRRPRHGLGLVPAQAAHVVGMALGRVGEDVVGEDDESVALDTDGGG